MPASIKLIQEADLHQAYRDKILPFWQQGKFGDFSGVDNIRINYAVFEQNKNPAQVQEKKLILVPGRSEGYLKYQELSYDLFQAGYSVYIIDHRGQGISQRLLPQPHKGYVKSFDHYSQDLHQFIDTIVKADRRSKNYLLAHSMGAAISARYLQQYDNPVTAAVFSSPMIAINSGIIPDWLAAVLIKAGNALNLRLGNSPWYFLGQGDARQKAFQGNPLMHSQVRYQKFTELYQNTEEIQLGGVTFHWLAEAIKTRKAIFSQLHKLKTPVTVLQAGADIIVDNRAQDEFCSRLHRLFPASCPGGEAIKIHQARHELFFEKDEFRNRALSQAINWFESH
ncbi:alpha/beta fold hydrolase [Thalassomonas viridans]|uniref:Alpha/beta fold hydrolase n=1 Tax=Thalassomonas viridans TaxID=137584 RepID=A0AAE9Z1A4_9GAMM|nr:alpha/beta fold hydrolase [Thalassomonas viridans]WDE04986.1 alpha/beta fold hydrolase [Thalassomonas viridans]